MKILVIPDTQVKQGVPTEHLTWAGKYIVDKQPDVVVHIGDHWDMPSLSGYDKGKRCYEGRTYRADIEAGNRGMDLLMAPLHAYNETRKEYHEKRYHPTLEFFLGNHEQRNERTVEMDRMLEGTVGYHNFNLEQHGWNVHEFLDPVVHGGVHFAHYFYNPRTGKPYGGQVNTMLKQIGFSFVMGHRQGKEQAEMYLSNGEVRRGLIVGSFYQHDEQYLGPQGTNYWRGVVMLHDVGHGNFNLMEVPMGFLRDKYA